MLLLLELLSYGTSGAKERIIFNRGLRSESEKKKMFESYGHIFCGHN